ncbi:right-handed parallel beta-helix repeat-containing protein [bacterium]|nr:right-handed parallel beta-helix repeat-containing protein [bacterium]
MQSAAKFALASVMVTSLVFQEGHTEVERGSWSALVPSVEGASEHFVSPEGTHGNPGTAEAPWDLASALAGQHKVKPGDIVWVRGGTYQGKFEVKLMGKESAPIIVRTYPGERATVLDSGVTVVEPASYVWIWGLEIAGSVPVEKRETKQTGSHPSDLPGTDGLSIYTGKACKFINLIIHDNVKGGVGWWVGSTDSEFHGCLIYNNGWRAPDRGHGHCIYTQNKEGIKTISSCIMSVPYDGSYTMHAYGSSRAYVDNFLIEDNVAYEKGPFLVGGGRPSHNIKVLRNYLHGVSMRIGYGAQNEDCELRDNVIARGDLTIQKYRQVVKEGNVEALPDRKTIMIPNKYDPNRAHLAIFNGARAREVRAHVAPFLKPGDAFCLKRAKDFFGKPLFEGKCKEKEITVPMEGEFTVFVVLKERGEP